MDLNLALEMQNGSVGRRSSVSSAGTLRSAQVDGANDHGTIAAPVGAPPAVANLPRLNLPFFYGDPIEWPAFWQAFESSMERQNFRDVDKLNYLFSYLKGKAARAVQGYSGGEN